MGIGAIVVLIIEVFAADALMRLVISAVGSTPVRGGVAGAMQTLWLPGWK